MPRAIADLERSLGEPGKEVRIAYVTAETMRGDKRGVCERDIVCAWGERDARQRLVDSTEQAELLNLLFLAIGDEFGAVALASLVIAKGEVGQDA